MFTHLLITRFNIIQEWYQHANRNAANVQTDEWLEERFRLFDAYCYPSVAAQDTSKFTWIVLFNSETPDKYRQLIAKYEQKCPTMQATFLEPFGNEDALIQQEISKRLTDDVSHIITTRLDSDDMIRADYISLIQSCFKPEMEDVFLNYAHGFQFDETQKILYDNPNKDQGHYLSRVVTINNRNNTVLVDHSIVASLAEYIEMDVTPGPAWVETIHSCNAWNRLASRRPLYNTKELKLLPPLNLSKSMYLKKRIEWIIFYSSMWIRRKIEKHIILRIKALFTK